jgi:hypothetical protein
MLEYKTIDSDIRCLLNDQQMIQRNAHKTKEKYEWGDAEREFSCRDIWDAWEAKQGISK